MFIWERGEGRGGKVIPSHSLLLCSFTLETKEMMQPPASVPVVHQCGAQGKSVAVTTL